MRDGSSCEARQLRMSRKRCVKFLLTGVNNEDM
jgi:hypothetical protein